MEGSGSGPVKAAREDTKPKRGRDAGAIPEMAGALRKPAGGRGRQKGGAMGAVSGPPLTVSTNTKIFYISSDGFLGLIGSL